MKLSSIINEDYIHLNGDLSNKDEIISFMIRHIERKYGFSLDYDSVIKIIDDREELGGTVLDNGLWIPHGRIDNLNDIIVSFYIPKTPLIIDDKEVKMVSLFLVGKHTANLYLKILSAIGQLTLDKVIYEELLASYDAKSFRKRIEKSGLEVSKHLSVADIMSSSIISLTPNDTVRQLTDLFYKKDISYMPIVDENENFIGEVTAFELLREGVPNYAMMLDNLSFLKTLEPFDKLLDNEDTILISKIMTKPALKITPDASIIEAAFELTQHQRRHLPVVSNGKIIGIISYKDILRKILRG